MRNKRLFFKTTAILLLLIFGLISYVSPRLQHIAYFTVAPSAFVLSLFAIPQWHPNRYVKTIIILYLWVAFTATTAIDLSLALRELRRIVGCFLMIISISQLCKDSRLVPWLYLVFIVYYLGIVYYAYTNIYTLSFDYTSERLDDDVLDANTVAYFTFYFTFALFILSEVFKNKAISRALRLLFILTPIWSFIIAILTGSRQVLLIQIPLISLLLYLRYFKNKKTFSKLAFISICIAAGLFFLQKGEAIYENSMLFQRTEESSASDPRIEHLRNAAQTGFEHPLVGVGPGNYGVHVYGVHTFSHSTYLELFANTGFPGLLIFVYLVCSFIIIQWKRYRRTKDSNYLLFGTFGVLFAVDNMLYVFYTAPWLISFFFLVAAHSENYSLNQEF